MLEIRAFTKLYDGRAVLKDVSLGVARGETLGVIGKSGCGKSTLLRHVACLEDAQTGEVSGEICLDGIGDLLKLSERKVVKLKLRGTRIGMVFQHSALFDFLDVEWNVRWPLEETGGVRGARARDRVREALSMVELPDDPRFLARDPTKLSGGERKRVALARALALSPSLVLYDEPTTGCDPPTVNELNRLIRSLQRQAGITGVVTSHDMRSVAQVCDRIAMIRDGAVLFTGSVEEALADARVKAFMAGEAAPGPGDGVAAADDDGGEEP